MNKIQIWLLEHFILPMIKREVGKFMDSKKWYSSKTVWSDIVTIITSVVTIFQASGTIATPIATQVLAVITAIAGAFGIYGRKVADTTIES